MMKRIFRLLVNLAIIAFVSMSSLLITPVNAKETDYKVKKGTEFAYMSDEWNVYIATAISDSVLKVEHWSKTLSSTKAMSFEDDLGIYKINDSANGFSWIDDNELSFTLKIQDKSNSRLKKETSVIFTINTSSSDDNKGANFDERIACYSYENDDWHLYRAIPLSDKFMKIETWSRTSSLDKYLYGDDVAIINITDNSTDFEWLDDDHDSFMMTLEDPDNKHYIKKPKVVLFELENKNYDYFSISNYLDRNEQETESKQEVNKETQSDAAPSLTAPPVDTQREYIKVTVDELKKALDDNPMRAKETYKNAYIEVTGKLDNIDASEKYISLIGANDWVSFVGAQCYTKNDYQKAQVREMNNGDMITLRGKCTYVGEIMGFQIDIDSIDGYEPSKAEVIDNDEYIICTASDLVNDLKNNAAKAKQKYLDHNVEVTGRISDIHSKGKSISIEPADDPYSFTSITCFTKTSELKKKVIELNKGDTVTIRGKCTLVGEVLGYSITVESIK